MVFSSLEFICVFLPVVFVLYYCIPGIYYKNVLLVIASLLFYAYGEPVYILLMIISAGFNYIMARIIAYSSGRRKIYLFIDVIINIGLLLYFKYMVFFIETWNYISGQNLNIVYIKLPVGISFFTFQALSYVIDVYYERIEVQKSFNRVLLYISFFPQLIAGPIIKYRDINYNLTNRQTDINQISNGVNRFIFGLGKKVLIANTVGQTADTIFNASSREINILSAWIGAVSYMLQIYYDFSGYSDMAIGLGKIFGFEFQENFKYPYGSVSIKEFWRRWHISLSGWFKEYLYIPLGGNRKGKIRTSINKFVVFFCTGFWHGANWTFIIWGLYHGFFSVIEEYVTFIKKIPKIFTYIYTMLIVCIGFVIFRADTLSQAFYMLRKMFTGVSFDDCNMSFVISQLNPWFIFMLFSGFIGMAPVKIIKEKLQYILYIKELRLTWKYTIINIFSYIVPVMLLVWCIIRLSGNTYNPFIYFRF
ncbi:MAG: MBOAT family protein [Lachnospiraceae bacterium]|nr:MBOAT family protein [Lachnospiraceae bacterium]